MLNIYNNFSNFNEYLNDYFQNSDNDIIVDNDIEN